MFLRSTRITIIAIPHLIDKYYEGVNTTSLDLSKFYNINSRAIGVSLHRLTQVGILKSQTGGVYPGFMFARTPKDISMYDVIAALEGDVLKMEMCRDVIRDINCGVSDCTSCKLYKNVNLGLNSINESLKLVSLHDHYMATLENK